MTKSLYPARKHKKRIIIWSCIAAVLAILIFSAFNSGLTVRHYNVFTDKIPSGSSIKIVVIADLHSVYYGEEQELLISKIKQQQPDIIALAGDIIDDNESEEGAIAFLEGINGIAPTYYVTGNHEIWSGEYLRIKDLVSSYGYTVLSNESKYISINGAELCVSGTDDPYILEYSEDNEKACMQSDEELLYGFSELDSDTFNILIAHRPERYDLYQQYDIDLVLSGHAHGGQIRLPGFINGFVAPDQGFFPKYAGGEYKENGQTMIVSRGLGFYAGVPRIFNPPEIVVVDILNAD